MNLSSIVKKLGEGAHFLTCSIGEGRLQLFDSAGREIEGVRDITVNQSSSNGHGLATVVLFVRFAAPLPMPKKR